MPSTLTVALLLVVPGLAAALAGRTAGPGPLPLAVLRLDMAVLGTLLAVLAVAVGEALRKRRKSFLAMLQRGIALRIQLVVMGLALLALGDTFGSRDYWDYSPLSIPFHLLGPARVLAGQSLLLSGLGLCNSADVLGGLAGAALGETFALYLFLFADALVFALLGMAGERGLPPFLVFQVVSRIGLTVAVVSIPLAFYGGRVGFWGVEPFAWFFAAVALGFLVPAALRR